MRTTSIGAGKRLESTDVAVLDALGSPVGSVHDPLSLATRWST
jgi:hypothetical protein